MSPNEKDSPTISDRKVEAPSPGPRDETPLPSARDFLLLLLNCAAAVLSASAVLGNAHVCFLLHMYSRSLPQNAAAPMDYYAAQWIGYATIAPNAILAASVISVGHYAFVKRKLPLFCMILAAAVAVFLGLADFAILRIDYDFPFAIELWGWQFIPSLVAPCTYCVLVFPLLLTGHPCRPKKQPAIAVPSLQGGNQPEQLFPPPNVL